MAVAVMRFDTRSILDDLSWGTQRFYDIGLAVIPTGSLLQMPRGGRGNLWFLPSLRERWRAKPEFMTL